MQHNGCAEHGAQLASMDATLKSILAEAKRTNGRVTKLEEEVNDVKNWQAAHDGKATGASTWLREAIAIATLLLCAWATWSAHEQARAATAAIIEVRQELRK